MKRMISALLALMLLFPTALAEEAVLNIVGSSLLDSSLVSAYTQASGVTIRETESVQSLTEQFAQVMAIRDGSVDVYILPTLYGLKNIKRSHFYLPLEGSAILSEEAELLYPAIRRAISDQARLVAWPVAVRPVLRDKRQKERIERLGLTYPETYDEYLDACVALLDADWWTDDRYCITQYAFDREHVMAEFIELYIFEQLARQEGVISFDTPDFRRIMERIRQEVPAVAAFEPDGTQEALLEMAAVAFETISERMILPVRIASDAQPAVDVEMFIAVVNPFSSRVDQAVAFLEYLAQTHGAGSYTYMRLSPWADEQTVAAIAQQEAALEALRGSATDDPDVLLDIEDAEKALQCLRTSAYIVSPAALDNYAVLAQGFVVPESPELRSDEAIHQLIQMYADGLLTIDQLIARLEDHVLMVTSE